MGVSTLTSLSFSAVFQFAFFLVHLLFVFVLISVLHYIKTTEKQKGWILHLYTVGTMPVCEHDRSLLEASRVAIQKAHSRGSEESHCEVKVQGTGYEGVAMAWGRCTAREVFQNLLVQLLKGSSNHCKLPK
jgi:hypothetical protein